MIELTCTCGKVFHAPDAMAGKRVWCKNCGAAISIPAVEQENNPVYEIEEIREELARFVNSRTARQPNEDRTGRRLPKAIALGGASASNPGLFRPTWPRYFLCFPHRLLVLIFCLLIAALCLYAIRLAWAWLSAQWGHCNLLSVFLQRPANVYRAT